MTNDIKELLVKYIQKGLQRETVNKEFSGYEMEVMESIINGCDGMAQGELQSVFESIPFDSRLKMAFWRRHLKQ
jgi:hypothetical protein